MRHITCYVGWTPLAFASGSTQSLPIIIQHVRTSIPIPYNCVTREYLLASQTSISLPHICSLRLNSLASQTLDSRKNLGCISPSHFNDALISLNSLASPWAQTRISLVSLSGTLKALISDSLKNSHLRPTQPYPLKFAPTLFGVVAQRFVLDRTIKVQIFSAILTQASSVKNFNLFFFLSHGKNILYV